LFAQVSFLQDQYQGRFGTTGCIEVLTWPSSAPIILLLLGIPMSVCIGCIVALLLSKKPQSAESAKSGPGANFDQGIKEP